MDVADENIRRAKVNQDSTQNIWKMEAWSVRRTRENKEKLEEEFK